MRLRVLPPPGPRTDSRVPRQIVYTVQVIVMFTQLWIPLPTGALKEGVCTIDCLERDRQTDSDGERKETHIHRVIERERVRDRYIET